MFLIEPQVVGSTAIGGCSHIWMSSTTSTSSAGPLLQMLIRLVWHLVKGAVQGRMMSLIIRSHASADLRWCNYGPSWRVLNRLHKVLESANIKLGNVASEVIGVSGRLMVKALIAGERDAGMLAELAKGRLRDKRAELGAALTGRFTDHHGFLLQEILAHVEFLDGAIADCDQRIRVHTRPFTATLDQLGTIPGVARRGAECILAEVGADMKQFASAKHVASWACICPGNNESAGKRRSGRMRRGNVWLRAILVECAWAAARTKGTYLAAQYARLARGRGGNKAVVAVAHSILVAVYYMLRDGTFYQDLGPAHFDQLAKQRLTR
jgi:hypothetical protein